MMIRVKLFAAARELVGQSELALELCDGATVDDVERTLVRERPSLKGLLAHCRWAVDAAFATNDTAVTEQSEIALIPPVSGG